MNASPIESDKLARTGNEYLALLASDSHWIARTPDDIGKLRAQRSSAFSKLSKGDFDTFVSSLLFVGGGVASGSYKPLMASLTLTEIFEVFAWFGMAPEYVLRIHEARCTAAGSCEFDFFSFCASNCQPHTKNQEQERLLEKLSSRSRGFCDVLKDAIDFLEREISRKEARIGKLKERLAKLQKQPDPDPVLIQEVLDEIRELEDALTTTDRPQLNAHQEEFSANCPV